MSADGPIVVGAARARSNRCTGFSFGPPSPGGSSSFVSFAGSRWKLWAEREAAVEISHSDPNESYTVVCWGIGGKTASSVFLALGCQSGRVQVWDPSTGELVGPIANAFSAIARGADCAISGLAPGGHERTSVFAACQGLPEVLEVGLLDGATRASFRLGKVGIARLASTINADWLLSVDAGASSSLKVWALPELSTTEGARTNQRPFARFMGPANSPTCVDVCSLASDDAAGVGSLNGRRLVALCADGTLQVDIFTCTGDSSKASPASLPATLTLSSHEPVQFASFVGAKNTQDSLVILGYGSSAVILWRLALGDLFGGSGATAKKVRTIVSFLAVGADELGGRVLSARYSGGSGSTASVVVSFGPGARPSFATARSTKGKATVEFMLADQKPKSAKPEETQSTATAAGPSILVQKAPTVLGPLQASAARHRPEKRRLEHGDTTQDDDEQRKRAKLPDAVPAVATGLSIAPIVRQGLRSGENQSIEQVLCQKDKRIQESTVAELTGAEAFDLLQECTKRLVSAPMNGVITCSWIQSVLTRHCAYIRSQPALRSALEPLHDALRARGSLHRTLVRLRGRLQLLRDLAKQSLDARQKECDNLRTPLLEYVEGDEDNVEEDSDPDENDEEEESGLDGSSFDPDDIFADEDSDD